jgi:peptidoglycan/xylan/chitin deacetylase (PgdA/CDA1 family)
MTYVQSSRLLEGYANNPPLINWPNQAQIAINFILNYEEGAESNVLDGDDGSENYLTDFSGITKLLQQRHFSSESLFEYGSRVGIWRLLTLFDEFQIPITLFAT